jgi:hypothetical protein
MPWRGHQSLLLRVRGGASAGGLDRRGAFCVGDYRIGPEVVRSMLARTSFFTGCSALLRGYDPVVARGRYFATASAEYRIPIIDIDRGLGTLPFFFRRIGLIPFVDVGNAWTDPTEFRDLLVSTGGSLVFSFELGYAEPIHLFFLYGHGFDDELGRDTFRAIVSTTF